MIFALTWLVCLQWLGERMAALVGLPLPGGLVGMVILLVALLVRGRLDDGLRLASQTLLRHLMLLFLPVLAGIVTLGPQLRYQWLPFLLSCVVATGLTMWVTAWTLRQMLRRRATP